MLAEQAYVFRHALLRDAGYQLHMPAERQRLHGLAFEVLEGQLGGRAPELPPLGTPDALLAAHPSDPFAQVLAEQARGGGENLAGARRLYLRRAAEHAERTMAMENSVRLWGDLAGISSGGARAEALRRAGALLAAWGRVRQAEPLLQEAAELHRAEGNVLYEAIALQSLGRCSRDLGRLEEAEERLRASDAVVRRLGTARQRSISLEALGSVLDIRGKSAEAREALLEALQLGRQDKGRWLAPLLDGLAVLDMETGHRAEAEERFREALRSARESGDERVEATVLGNFGHFLRDQNRLAEAEEAYERSIRLHRQVGNRRHEGVALGGLAALRGRQGRMGEAEALSSEALAIHREVGNRRLEGVAHGQIAILLANRKRVDEAARSLEAAIAIAREVGDLRHVGVSLGNLATLHLGQGALDAARREIEEAIAIHERTENRRFVGFNTCSLALVMLAQGDAGGAREAWRRAVDLLRRIGEDARLETMRAEMRKACEKAGVEPFRG